MNEGSALFNINLLWAKREPFHPLLRHCIDTGMVCRELLASPAFAAVLQLFKARTSWPADMLSRFIAFIVALHDIGKCDSDFQAKWPEKAEELRQAGLVFDASSPREGFRHELRSRMWLQEHLKNPAEWDGNDVSTITSAIGIHHGGFKADQLIRENPFQQKQWDTLRLRIHDELAVLFGVNIPLPTPCITDHGVVGTILSGLLVMSDWIASNEELFQWHTLPTDQPINIYAAQSATRAASAVNRLGLIEPLPFREGAGFLETWGHLNNIDRLYPLQEAVADLCRQNSMPAVTVIEAPMGEGKTEAALHLATQWAAGSRRGGIYVALPTAATSNQMHERLTALAKHHAAPGGLRVGLVHGMSWVLDEAVPQKASNVDNPDESDDSSAEWFRPSRRALLAPFAVGTVDQALMATLNVRFGFLRLLGLAKGVLVIDEVHAYDAYMSTILERLLQWCGALAVPVVLLSATLTGRQKTALINAYRHGQNDKVLPDDAKAEYPQEHRECVVTVLQDNEVRPICCHASVSKSIAVCCHRGIHSDAPATACLAVEAIANGGCACVLLNTVGAAQEVYGKLQSMVDENTQLVLFHARFPAERRAELEREVLDLFDKRSLARPAKAILVATQVVEQSLDVDFDVLITQVAPVDLLLQRMGRLHRHHRPHRPTGRQATVHLLLPPLGKPGEVAIDFGASEKVYSRFILLRSMAIVSRLEKSGIELPHDIRPLVEEAYEESTACCPQWRSLGITEADLTASLKLEHKEREKMEAEPKKYLIPKPYRRSFKLAQLELPLNDSSDKARSSFHVTTRYGNDNVRVLLLEDDEFRQELGSSNRPSKEVLRSMLMRELSISAEWILNTTPADGYEPTDRPQRWLGGRKVLRLVKGKWKGWRNNNTKLEVAYDVKLGVSVGKA